MSGNGRLSDATRRMVLERMAELDFTPNLNAQRFMLWDASTNQQTNFDSAADLNHTLYQVGLEAPDGLDRALSKGFRPKNPV